MDESLDALFQHATEGILITNEKGKISKANPSSEKMFGYAKNELLNKTVEELIPTRYKTQHIKNRATYNNKPHARAMGKNMNLLGKRKDNTEFPVEVSLSYYKKGENTFVIAFIIDITERREHEENIKKLNQDLEKKVKERTNVLQEALLELEKSKEQLSSALANEKELNDLKSRFVTMASHEFRTPLSTILSSVSLISKYPGSDDDEKRQRHVLRVKSAVTNMTLILNDFLSAERLEEGKTFVRKEIADLQHITNEVLTEINGILKNGQKVKYIHKGNTEASLDKQMVRNILLNLVSNAIKFSPEYKDIEVYTTISAHEISIKVTDYGVGIPKEEQTHLFERFFRAKNVTNIQGTGLGLNIVGKYLEAMNGGIEFKSELNKGTTFTVSIPNE
ncbi:MAG: PAS domain-containing sensor histidine kinase [Bacteroidia bacterium]